MSLADATTGRDRERGDQPRTRSLITPEGIDLDVRLGDAAQRASAFAIDALIILALLVVVTMLALYAAAAAGKSAAQGVMIIWILGAFVLRNGFFLGFELTQRAATPGKRALGLRVAARNGGRLTADAVFARNAMRELELYLPLAALGARAGAERVDGWMYLASIAWVGVFALFPLFNRDRLRVGDLVAGTWVVQAPERKLEPDLADEGVERAARYNFTQAQISAYGVKELQVLEDVLRRQDRRTLAAVAERIRRKIGWEPARDEGDLDFLSAYYAALRGRLETGLLFGRRRADKHDVDGRPLA